MRYSNYPILKKKENLMLQRMSIPSGGDTWIAQVLWDWFLSGGQQHPSPDKELLWIVRSLSETEQISYLLESTAGHPDAAAVATAAVLEEYETLFKRPNYTPIVQRGKKFQELSGIDSLDAARDRLDATGRLSVAEIAKQLANAKRLGITPPPHLLSQFADCQHAIASLQQWGKDPDSARAKTRYSRTAVENALARIHCARYTPGIGGDGILTLLGKTPDERVETITALSPHEAKRVSDVLQALGKMRSEFGGLLDSPSPTLALTLGNDIPNLLPEELAKDEDLFALGFAESRLLQYPESAQGQPGGNLLFYLDFSGSMRSPQQTKLNGATLEAWSKALVLFLVETLQGQDVTVIPFTQLPLESYAANLSEEPDRALSLLKASACGVENWHEAMDDALRRIREEEGETPPDVLLVTDGCSRVNRDWVESFLPQKQALGVSIVALWLSPKGDLDGLESFCDRVIPVYEWGDTGTCLSAIAGGDA